MDINAHYDQTFSRAIRNIHGEITGYEPLTHHFTFGKTGDTIAGGFYIKVGEEMPKAIRIQTVEQSVKVILPAIDLHIKLREKDNEQYIFTKEEDDNVGHQ